MKLSFLLLFIAYCFTATAQYNQLLLRKDGRTIMRYTEGSVITIQTKLGLKYTGTIYLIQNDSVWVVNLSGHHWRLVPRWFMALYSCIISNASFSLPTKFTQLVTGTVCWCLIYTNLRNCLRKNKVPAIEALNHQSSKVLILK